MILKGRDRAALSVFIPVISGTWYDGAHPGLLPPGTSEPGKQLRDAGWVGGSRERGRDRKQDRPGRARGNDGPADGLVASGSACFIFYSEWLGCFFPIYTRCAVPTYSFLVSDSSE